MAESDMTTIDRNAAREFQLSYLAGVLHGDGWCTSRSFGLRSKDWDFACAFSTAAFDVLRADIRPHTDERGYWLVRASNARGRFDGLKDFEPHDDATAGAWLRGLFDSEGNAQLWLDTRAGPFSFSRRIAIYSTSLPTLDRVAMMMATLGIPASRRLTRNSASHKGLKPVHELRVLRQEGFAQFAATVGSTIERKRSTIRAIVVSYQAPGYQARNWQKAVAARWGTRT